MGGLWRLLGKLGAIHVAEKCSDVAFNGESEGWPFLPKTRGNRCGRIYLQTDSARKPSSQDVSPGLPLESTHFKYRTDCKGVLP